VQPKLVESFDDLKIVAIATGDEFSLAVDEKGVPWVWGKNEKGQVRRLWVPQHPQQPQSSVTHPQVPCKPVFLLQLGISLSDRTHSNEGSSGHSRRSHSLFKPHPISSIAPMVDVTKSPREMVSHSDRCCI
jgi:hypothetical protein